MSNLPTEVQIGPWIVPIAPPQRQARALAVLGMGDAPWAWIGASVLLAWASADLPARAATPDPNTGGIATKTAPAVTWRGDALSYGEEAVDALCAALGVDATALATVAQTCSAVVASRIISLQREPGND